MRVVLYFTCMFFLLIGGKQSLYADKHQNKTSTSYNHYQNYSHSLNFSNKEQFNSIIEESDLDVEEEHFGEDLHDEFDAKVWYSNKHSNNVWFGCTSNRYVSNYYTSHIPISPFLCSNPTPIFIQLQVLRI
jgi:hypothetical protein